MVLAASSVVSMVGRTVCVPSAFSSSLLAPPPLPTPARRAPAPGATRANVLCRHGNFDSGLHGFIRSRSPHNFPGIDRLIHLRTEGARGTVAFTTLPTTDEWCWRSRRWRVGPKRAYSSSLRVSIVACILPPAGPVIRAAVGSFQPRAPPKP